MRRHHLGRLLLAVALLPTSTRIVGAQQIRLDAALGGAIGLARYGQLLPNGVAAQVGAEATIGSGFAATFEVEQARFRGDGDAFGVERLRQSLTTARLGVRYRPPIAGRWRPYVLGGAGIGRRGELEPFDQSVTGMTLHAGGGVEVAVGGAALVAESRYQTLLLAGRDQEQLTLLVGLRSGQAPRHASRSSAAAPGAWARRRVSLAAATTVGQRSFGELVPDRPLQLLAVQGSWLLAGGSQNAIEYTAEVLPLVVGTTLLAAPGPGGGLVLGPDDGATARTTGVGLLPLGLRGLIGITGGLRATVEVSAGLLLFDRDTPISLGTRRANFTYGGAAGVEQRVTGTWSATAAYRYLHYSNGRSAALNPAEDVGMVQVGIRRHW